MHQKKDFGVQKDDSLLKTLFTNDWLHTTLCGQFDESRHIQEKAKAIIYSLLVVSSGTVVYGQSSKSTSLTISGVYALLIAVMQLSNATKNQKDAVSGFLQSYASNLINAMIFCSIAYYSGSILVVTLASIMLFNAFYGFKILNQLYNPSLRQQVMVEGLIENKTNEEKEFNSRLPELVNDNQLFTKGWKFNLFNETKQFWKQISAVCVIFSTIFFSMMGIFNGKDYQSFCILTLVYSLICLFSFFNETYVRDFDALQVNFMPVALTMISMLQTSDFVLYGLTLSLMADAYYGIRYRDDCDQIEYTPLELFSMQSWSQQAFESKDIKIQLQAAVIIFAQLYLTILSAVGGQGYQLLFLAFYLVKLNQFFFKSIVAFDMAQSNMVCLALAVISLSTLVQQFSIMATLSSILLFADAYIGLFKFALENKLAIFDYLKFDTSIIKSVTSPLIQDDSDQYNRV